MVKRRDFLVGTGGATAASFAIAADVSPTDESKSSALPIGNVFDPTYIDERLDSRSIGPENPNGARGGGGKVGDGRKNNADRTLPPGEKLVLAQITGSGTVRHIWMTFDFGVPEVMRAQRFEVFYDEASEPSISVPVLDFFGSPHGRRAEYYSALVSVNEGLGLNSHIPIPFGRSIRVELTNESAVPIMVDWQFDYTLEPPSTGPKSFLHATFRRENPTTLRRDFVIVEGLKGPGRFLGCSVGIRVLDRRFWYGEGEVKIYRDGDKEFPTYCGTGLEDYVGSAWNLDRHWALYAGAPLNLPKNFDSHREAEQRMPQLCSFYRWHLPDPIMFAEDIRVTIQQIGDAWFKPGEEAQLAAYRRAHSTAGGDWQPSYGTKMKLIAGANVERSDDYCATAFVYCRERQAVHRYETSNAIRDMGLLPGEKAFNMFMSDES